MKHEEKYKAGPAQQKAQAVLGNRTISDPFSGTSKLTSLVRQARLRYNVQLSWAKLGQAIIYIAYVYII